MYTYHIYTPPQLKIPQAFPSHLGQCHLPLAAPWVSGGAEVIYQGFVT